MFSIIFFQLIILFLTTKAGEIELLGIEPLSGPDYGETRVLVRLNNFSNDLKNDYPHPKCRFGDNEHIVNGTYVRCSSRPRKIGEKEPTIDQLNETCIQCENSPPHEPDFIPFTASIIGDFTDVKNSFPFRYYAEPKITWIYPRYGPKDGNTYVEVFGENFLNYDQNLRCGFGSREVKAYYVNENYIICYSPPSDVVGHKLPFTISLNNQQNTKQDVPYVYYNQPQVSRLEKNRGPDSGGMLVKIRGQNLSPFSNATWNNHNDTYCRFGNLSLEVATVISSTELQCISPPSYEEREVPVEITLNNREWTNDEVMYYYYHPPFVYFINPKIGPVSGGTEVIITGSNFENTGYVMCRFGTVLVEGRYINENELRCISPQVEKPGKVALGVAIRNDEFSSGMNTMYTYYATPKIDSIEPACGPERGFTQLTLRGSNFPDKDSEYVKCVFDRKIFMNATVMSDTEIKCDTPSVLNYAGLNENNITEYNVELTLNGVDINGPALKFYYYRETITTEIIPNRGPIDGNTTVNITGFDFTQKGACNVTVRFSTYHVKPDLVEKEYMVVKSPAVNLTGSVVVQVSLNGRQFEKDPTLNYEDKQNTFYYYQTPHIMEMRPLEGPAIGGSEINLFGINFDEPFYDTSDRLMYYRFISCDDEKNIVGDIYNTTIYDAHSAKLLTPNTFGDYDKLCLQTSYNKENFKTVPGKEFKLYVLPNITDINPKYGPLKSSNQEIRVKLDNYLCTSDCEKIKCRFKSKSSIFYLQGTYVSPNNINCLVPKVNIPESYNVEVSFNGETYTKNNMVYTFYDPYIIKVTPQMVSSKGNTKITINGFGFADTGDNLKVRFGSNDNKLKCDYKNCFKEAKFINENQIEASTFEKNLVTVDLTGKNIGFERFAVEVSVYNDDFTNNNITIYYYDEPEIIQDLYDGKVNMTAADKQTISESLTSKLPANLDTFIHVPINSSIIQNYFNEIEPYANYTCRYEIGDSYKVTKGFITSFPNNSSNKNIFICKSPEWDSVGEGKIRISLNGEDFSESFYPISFTDPVGIVKMLPSCGPLHGGTDVKLFGTGFSQDKNHIFKWGVQNLVPMDSASFLDFARDDEISLLQKSNYKVQRINVKSPIAPYYINTLGGLDYISISQKNYVPLDDRINQYYSNKYIRTNNEYYYYKQPYVQSFTPHGSIVTGGTKILVIGAWFQYKPEYGVRPFCKFGDKIVEGEYLSTVRITCIAPSSSVSNVKLPFEVSLNGVDFTDSGLKFIYYNDFRYAKFEKIVPSSGPETGGTQIRLYGQNFTNLVNPEEFLCQFKPVDPNIAPRVVPAGYKEFKNNSAIICNTPGGWKSGTKAKILITFDGQNYMETKFQFYFYKIDEVIPKAGPTTGGDPINIKGGGFKNSSLLHCQLNGINYAPISMSESLIQCPMPPADKQNFTGAVDFSVMLNGIDPKSIKDGFYYYIQPKISSIYPKTGPNNGNALVKVFGNGFRKDFKGVNLGCKIGSSFGYGEYVSDDEMNCFFNKIPLVETNKTLNLSIALNNYSFTEENINITFVPYGISVVHPGSASLEGTRLQIKGKGFHQSNKIRCRFGVEGYYAYTTAEFINYEEIVCPSPENYQLPNGASFPFTVPFSIAFNDDEFNPWTESSHFVAFYESPLIESVYPIEGSTKHTTEVSVFAEIKKPFSTPSATIEEEEIIDYTEDNPKYVLKKNINYQPIACRFGRFGITQAVYVNRTVIKCLTPMIKDDSDIGYEEVIVEVALNGVDFVSNEDVIFTFKGPNAGKMLWVYILLTILTAALIILVATLFSSYWNRVLESNRNVYNADEPHVKNQVPRYVVSGMGRQLMNEGLIAEDGRRNIGQNII